MICRTRLLIPKYKNAAKPIKNAEKMRHRIGGRKCGKKSKNAARLKKLLDCVILARKIYSLYFSIVVILLSNSESEIKSL
jgi:hypothetical protein